MIDSPGGWCSGANTVGNWIELDNGKLGSLSGIITQGRKNASQWVKSFKLKNKDGRGSWRENNYKTLDRHIYQY